MVVSFTNLTKSRLVCQSLAYIKSGKSIFFFVFCSSESTRERFVA